MQKVIPNKLKKGDEVRVIAPSRSFAIISQETRAIAKKKFDEMGLKVSFGKHVEEINDFDSSSIESRVSDLHDAFSDKNVKGILAVIGGFNSNQLLDYIDWELIKNNPKILCGFSDITALNNSFFTKTGLVTYSGPQYSTFGQKLYFDYTLDYFKKCLLNSEEFEIEASKEWSDDEWYRYQDKRNLIPNEGYWVINEGKAEGTILGANLCTFNLLQGTQYMPNIKGSILFIEDDYESQPCNFDRDLQSVIHLPDIKDVKGIVIGRFQKQSNITLNLLQQIIRSKKSLANIPVIGNVDFGHTDPKITFPIGGSSTLVVTKNKARININNH